MGKRLFSQTVDGEDSILIKRRIALDRALNRAHGVVRERIVIRGLDAKLGQMHRHADFLKEALHGQDTLARGALRAGKVHFHAEHAVCQLGKARDIVLHLIHGPCREQHGQACAVRDLVAEGAQLMLELVHREQARAAAAGIVVVRYAARPHQRGARFVVVRVFDCAAACVARRDQHTLCNAVGDVALAARRGQVTLERVHHNIHDATAGLELGHGKGVLRIEEADARAVGLAGDAALFLGFFIGQHAGVTGLRAGGCERQHGCDRQGLVRRGAGRGEFPRVASSSYAQTDGLGGVDDRAAADGEDKVDPLALAKLDAAARHGYLGVGLDTAQFNKTQPCVKQAFFNLIEQAGRTRARTAEMHQHAVRAEILELGADLPFDITAENDLSGSVDGKIQHSGVILPFLMKMR